VSAGPEFEQVEAPFIDQLVSMGWRWTTGNVEFSTVTGRESFREVLILDDLRKAIVRINRNHQGEEWLDQGRVSQAVSALRPTKRRPGCSSRASPWRGCQDGMGGGHGRSTILTGGIPPTTPSAW
jgi:hypothetical protein